MPKQSYLDLFVVGSFITITSVISPYLLKYSLRPSVRDKGKKRVAECTGRCNHSGRVGQFAAAAVISNHRIDLICLSCEECKQDAPLPANRLTETLRVTRLAVFASNKQK